MRRPTSCNLAKHLCNAREESECEQGGREGDLNAAMTYVLDAPRMNWDTPFKEAGHAGTPSRCSVRRRAWLGVVKGHDCAAAGALLHVGVTRVQWQACWEHC